MLKCMLYVYKWKKRLILGEEKKNFLIFHCEAQVVSFSMISNDIWVYKIRVSSYIYIYIYIG